MTDIERARYLATPRQCVTCGGEPSAGRPGCDDCHSRRVAGLPPVSKEGAA